MYIYYTLENYCLTIHCLLSEPFCTLILNSLYDSRYIQARYDGSALPGFSTVYRFSPMVTLQKQVYVSVLKKDLLKIVGANSSATTSLQNIVSIHVYFKGTD